MNRPDSADDTSRPDPVEVRPVRAHEELDACVELQRAAWGAGYDDLVPASMLKISREVGGVLLGAFAASGELVGFVYGLTGPRDGRIVHWSHMLAVRPDRRDRGVGRRLKEAQARAVRALGVDRILWTFDPLVARNAHLNLNRLGVRVVEYVRDMYGPTGSPLHAFGTDRFVVAWHLDERSVGEAAGRAERKGGTWESSGEEPRTGEPSREEPRTESPEDALPVLNAGPGAGTDLPDSDPLAAGRPVGVRIPADIAAVQAHDPTEARAWRRSTRGAFERCLGAGYRVTGFRGDSGGGLYRLTLPSPAGEGTPGAHG